MNKSTLILGTVAFVLVVILLIFGSRIVGDYQAEQSITATAVIELTHFTFDESNCYKEIPDRNNINDFLECMRKKGHFPTITPAQ